MRESWRPRLRLYARGLVVVAALGVIAWAALSILQTPVAAARAGVEPTRAIAPELLAIGGAVGVAVFALR